MSSLRKRIQDSLIHSPVSIDDDQISKIELFCDLLKYSPIKSSASWDDDDTGLYTHLYDSIQSFEPRMEKNQNVLDIGSGSGVPGIIFAIFSPSSSFTLIESQQKRCRFLNECLQTLKMTDQVRVINGRAEILAHQSDLRESFDIVTARALAEFSTFLEYTCGFIKTKGFLHALRGEKDKQIIESQRSVIAKFKLKFVQQRSYTFLNHNRYVFLFEKIATLPNTLPRSNQMIRKSISG